MANKYREYMETPVASLSITENGTYDVVEKAEVVVNASKPEQSKSAYATTSSQTITPDSGYALSSVSVGAISQNNLTAANIKKDTVVNINNGNTDIISVTGTYQEIDRVSSVPSTKSTDIIYNTSDSSYYMWEYPNYLCFTANEANSTIGMSLTDTPTRSINFEYSIDRNTWNTFTVGSTIITLANIGDKAYFRGNNPNGISYNNEHAEEFWFYTFLMTGNIAASGNIMSLVDITCESLTIPCDGCFYNMFKNCTSLTTAPTLPATTLAENCYLSMFRNCTSLTTAPALPATALADYCYGSMFYGCTSLTTAPALHATMLVGNCCFRMFQDCTSLYVSDTSVSGTCDKAWRIPATGTFTNTCPQGYVFTNCLGTRSSDDMPGEQGQSYTYYTQNTPV